MNLLYYLERLTEVGTSYFRKGTTYSGKVIDIQEKKVKIDVKIKGVRHIVALPFDNTSGIDLNKRIKFRVKKEMPVREFKVV